MICSGTALQVKPEACGISRKDRGFPKQNEAHTGGGGVGLLEYLKKSLEGGGAATCP